MSYNLANMPVNRINISKMSGVMMIDVYKSNVDVRNINKLLVSFSRKARYFAFEGLHDVVHINFEMSCSDSVNIVKFFDVSEAFTLLLSNLLKCSIKNISFKLGRVVIVDFPVNVDFESMFESFVRDFVSMLINEISSRYNFKIYRADDVGLIYIINDVNAGFNMYFGIMLTDMITMYRVDIAVTSNLKNVDSVDKIRRYISWCRDKLAGFAVDVIDVLTEKLVDMCNLATMLA